MATESTTPLPPTTIKSWSWLCQQADPDFIKESRQPIAYEFSNGQTFRQKPDPYSTP